MYKNELTAAVYGFAVGDAFGLPFEFESREYMGQHPVMKMNSFGTHNQPAGTWSDDTSMTLALLDSLSGSELDLSDIARRFVSWYRTGKYTPDGIVFDIGISTEKAINALENGCDPYSSGADSEFDNGNGSLMYIMPLAFFLCREKNIHNRMKAVFDVSGITHNHIRSKIACFFYCELIISLIKHKNIEKAYQSARENMNKSGVFETYAEEYNNFSRLMENHIKALDVNEIKSSGYVINTLECALWCNLRSQCYEDAVISAVMLGEDTDTTAAVTGALAAVAYGIESIPETWINTIVNQKLIKSILKKY